MVMVLEQQLLHTKQELERLKQQPEHVGTVPPSSTTAEPQAAAGPAAEATGSGIALAANAVESAAVPVAAHQVEWQHAAGRLQQMTQQESRQQQGQKATRKQRLGAAPLSTNAAKRQRQGSGEPLYITQQHRPVEPQLVERQRVTNRPDLQQQQQQPPSLEELQLEHKQCVSRQCDRQWLPAGQQQQQRQTMLAAQFMRVPLASTTAAEAAGALRQSHERLPARQLLQIPQEQQQQQQKGSAGQRALHRGASAQSALTAASGPSGQVTTAQKLQEMMMKRRQLNRQQTQPANPQARAAAMHIGRGAAAGKGKVKHLTHAESLEAAKAAAAMHKRSRTQCKGHWTGTSNRRKGF